MQGIQLMASFDDAWGGFASDYIERLRDEYGKTAIWVWGLEDSFRGVPRVSFGRLNFRLFNISFRANTKVLGQTPPQAC